MSSGPSTAAVLRDALRRAPALGRGLWLTVALAVAGTAIQVVVPVVLQQLVDRDLLAPGGVDVGGALRRGALAGMILVLGALAIRTSLRRLVRSSSTGLSDLRVDAFRHLMGRSLLHVQEERRGGLVSRVTSDVETIQQFMEWGGVGLLVSTAQVVLALGVMVAYEWRLTLVVAAGVTLYAATLMWFQRLLRRSYDRVRLEVGHSLAVLGEAISGLPVVRAYGVEEVTTHRVDEALESRFQTEYRTARLGNVLFSTAEVFAGTLTAAVIVVGLLLGAAQGTSAGTLLAFLFLVNLLVEPVQLVVETLENAQSAASGLRRVLAVLDEPVDVADPGPEGVELPPGPLEVRFRDVSFRYPSGTEALAGVSTVIPAGRRLAVVGETGSGKTTFAKLLVRLLDPSAGAVEVGGIDLRRVRFSSLRSRVAFVPQDGFLFDASLADNVRYGKPEASDREVATAFLELGLDWWLERLPGGLGAPVGERGGNLSAGERQLVALVRAWISEPDLLVLDEATSAVDPALDVELRRAIERVIAGRTSVTIAHRLATAEAADEVLVFDGGRLVERGEHWELLGAEGVYAALYADWMAGTRSG